MSKFSRIILVLVLSLFQITSVPVAFTETQQKISTKIGMLLPLSGQYAALGLDCEYGLEIAKSEINPKTKIDFVLADTRAEATQAVVEFRKLADLDKVPGMFVMRGPSGMAVNPFSKATKIPLLGGISNKNFALSNEYAFQLWPRSDLEGEFLATRIFEKGFRKVAVLTVQDDFPIALSDGFRQKIKTQDSKIVFDEEILPTETDFRSQILNIKQVNLDVLFLNSGLNQIAPILLQLRQMGVSIPVVSNFWAGKKEVIAAAGKAAEGLMFSEMSTDLVKLKADLRNKFNSTASGATVATYVAANMIAQALEGLEDVSTERLYSRLNAIKEIKTLNGNFEVKDRFVQFPLVLRVIQNGEVT